jgi:hypothetical protein
MSSQDRPQLVPGPASNGGTDGKTLGEHLRHFLVPIPKLGPPINPDPSEARGGARGGDAEPGCRQDHSLFRLDAVRLSAHRLVRLLDRLRSRQETRGVGT